MYHRPGLGQILLDWEYIILATVLTLIGVTGVILFNGAQPPGGECTCLIPSPENTAMQGTSGILLIFGVLFIPIGILKGGLPTRREGPPLGRTVGSGRTYTPEWISSGTQLVLGIAIIILGADAVAVPGYVVLHNPSLIVGGAIVAALGLLLVMLGSQRRKQ
jgi:hypothetical protein